MVQQTRLLYINGYFNPNENLNDDIDFPIGWKMIKGDIIYIVPDVYDSEDFLNGSLRDLSWDDFEASSSQEYINKFAYANIVLNYFPFIQESVINNLADFIKKNFIDGYMIFIINDEFTNPIVNYVIRFQLKKDVLTFTFEIIYDENLPSVKIELCF